MPRVHKVEKARKSYPDHGIKKGESYYWWAFRYGGKRMSKVYPKPQQLTQSDFLIGVYDIQDRIAELAAETLEDLEGEIQSIADDIRAHGDEQQDKLSNMPEGLQQGSTGELLQERADAMESWASDVEGVDIGEVEEDETLEEHIQTVINDVQALEPDLP